METVSNIGRSSYDYYHLNKSVNAEDRRAKTAWYYRDLSEEEIRNNNIIPNKDYEGADVCRSVAEKFEAAAQANRSRYGSADEVKNAVWAKYSGGAYMNLSSEERGALARAEIKMTLYGTVNYGDARIIAGMKGEVTKNTLGRDETENRIYNANMLGKQIGNVFANGGVDTSLLGNRTFSFRIDGVTKKLTVVLSGDDGEADENSELIEQMTKAINSKDNAKNLFYNLLYDSNKRGIIPKDQLAKWSLFSDFQNVTGLDIRTFKQTEQGFVNEEGHFARDIYKEALKHNKIAGEFKGMAYDYFTELEAEAMRYNISEVPDLTLSLEYQNGYVRFPDGAGTFDVSV